MSKTDDTVLEIDDSVKSAIAKEVSEGMKEQITNAVKEASEATAKELAKQLEKVEKKDLEGEPEGGDPNAKRHVKSQLEKDAKETRFMRAAAALSRGDLNTVREYNELAIASRQKAGYGNTSTNADGAFLVPDADFDAEVERLQEQYGVAFRYADVRNINGNSVKLNKLSEDIVLTETNEAANKPGVKLEIAQVTADLRKFTGIAPATEELIEDSAVDYWAEVAQSFARARAKKADELVFTDATSGILETSGIITVPIGSSTLSDITLDDLADATVAVPTDSAANGAFFMHRSVFNILRQKKATDSGVYHLAPGPNGSTTPTIWGYPVILTEVLPSTTTIQANDGAVVFGDLRYVKLYNKRGLQLKQLTEATVNDADGSSVNLALQDMEALRAVSRMLSVVKFANAFAVIGTGTVS